MDGCWLGWSWNTTYSLPVVIIESHVFDSFWLYVRSFSEFFPNGNLNVFHVSSEAGIPTCNRKNIQSIGWEGWEMERNENSTTMSPISSQLNPTLSEHSFSQIAAVHMNREDTCGCWHKIEEQWWQHRNEFLSCQREHYRNITQVVLCHKLSVTAESQPGTNNMVTFIAPVCRSTNFTTIN